VGFPRFIAVIWLVLMCALAPAHAEKRVALVIGNDRYASLAANQQLLKAVNDARAVGGALRQIGFEVILGENLGRRALVGKLNELMQRLAPGDMVFFFFSGHGVALDGVNYILPADMPDIAAGQDTSLRAEALSEQYVVSEITERRVRVAIVVLDACRTNPFSRPSGKGVGMAKGLAPPPQIQGIFSLYAASSGQAALDRLYDGDPNPNSVFTRVLAPMLKKPGLDLRDLAYEVREEVARTAQTAGHEQRPEDRDGTLGGRLYLAGQPPPPGGQPAIDAAQAWSAVQNSMSIAVLDDFLRQFSEVPIYGPLARERREKLEKQPMAEPPALPAMPPAAPASSVVRAHDTAELAQMIKNGARLMANGDIAGARMMYQRAAEAGDAAAAFALAETYDPLVLAKGDIPPDIGLARMWYTKAMDLGSTLARERLETMARARRAASAP
jgi:hypothetical protein